ncbi:MAG TPA: EF-hand domain-containing protein [Sphingomicrobium sp.]
MKKYLIGGAAAAAIVAGGAAFAQMAPQTAPAARAMKTATRADVQARVAKMFARLDVNHDGFITKEEVNGLEAQREQKAEQRAARFDPSKAFDHIDLNHDGKITVDEAKAARSQHASSKGGEPAQAHATAFGGLFAKADANHDGVITRAEFDTMGQQIKARMEQAGLHHGGGMASSMLGSADANKDGRVSLAEAQQVALQHFDRLDLNHDGQLTPQERQQARQLLKGQRKPN